MDKGPFIQSYYFSSSHICMWELDHKEGRTLKNWCFRTVALEEFLGQQRRSNQSILKEINSEYSLEGQMPKLKLQYFGHPMWRTDSLEKTLMLGKTRQEEKGVTEDEMVGWHHWFDGHKLGKGQGGLACCSPRGHDKNRIQLGNWTTTATLHNHHLFEYYRNPSRLDLFILIFRKGNWGTYVPCPDN